MEPPMEEGASGWRTPHRRNHGQDIRSGIHPQTANSQETVENLTDERPDKKPRQNRPRKREGIDHERKSMVERERRRLETHKTSRPTT
jgi:hypothetical protein